MHQRRIELRTLLLMAAALAATTSAGSAAAKDDDVAAITKLEHDAVKADLAGDAKFYERYLSKDFTAGTSFGEWESRESMLKDMADPERNKMNSEEISDLKVRVYGNTAVATYRAKYDGVIRGEPRARSIIATDVFVKGKDGWKLTASHASEAKK